VGWANAAYALAPSTAAVTAMMVFRMACSFHQVGIGVLAHLTWQHRRPARESRLQLARRERPFDVRVDSGSDHCSIPATLDTWFGAVPSQATKLRREGGEAEEREDSSVSCDCNVSFSGSDSESPAPTGRTSGRLTSESWACAGSSSCVRVAAALSA
jgi:hypothetical protein